jgi:hypothetical protein
MDPDYCQSMERTRHRDSQPAANGETPLDATRRNAARAHQEAGNGGAALNGSVNQAWDDLRNPLPPSPRLGTWLVAYVGYPTTSQFLLYTNAAGIVRAWRAEGVYHGIPDDCAVERVGSSCIIPWHVDPHSLTLRYELTVESPTRMTGVQHIDAMPPLIGTNRVPIVCTYLPPGG